jgi:hypothetical protein
MRMMLVVLAGLAAAACNSPKEVAATRPSVSYRVPQGQGVEADQRAMAYCANYNLRPTVVRTVPESGGVLATYECR